MYKSKSNLRKEDEEPKVMPMAMPTSTSTSIVMNKTNLANFTENINQGLGIGGCNGNLNSQIPQSMDSMGAAQLSHADIEKILNEI